MRERWNDFIHTHHYDIFFDFFESWIALHPRRTGEIYYRQFIEANFVDTNPAPREVDLDTLIEWHQSLFEAESKSTSDAGDAAEQKAGSDQV